MFVANDVSANGIGNPGNNIRSAFPVVVEVPVLVTVQEQVLSFLHEKTVIASHFNEYLQLNDPNGPICQEIS